MASVYFALYLKLVQCFANLDSEDSFRRLILSHKSTDLLSSLLILPCKIVFEIIPFDWTTLKDVKQLLSFPEVNLKASQSEFV